MASTRERVIQAVADILIQALPQASHVRNGAKPERLTAYGYVGVDDGDPGEPEIVFSPMTYIYEHLIPVDVAAPKTKTETAEARLDAMLQAISAALAVDRTLGGLCDWIDVAAAVTEPLTAEGAASSRATTVEIRAIYGTTDPLN